MNRNSKASGALIGILCIIIGIGVLISNGNKQKKCTQPVNATIVDVTRRTKTVKSGNRKRKETVYRPEFTYVVDGVEYKGYADSVSSSTTYKVGGKISINVDPKKPKNYYVVSDMKRSGKSTGFAFIGFGVLAMIFGTGSGNSRRRQNNNQQNYY